MRKAPTEMAAVVMCLSIGAAPTLGQDAPAAPSPSPETSGQPADDSPRIVAVESLDVRTRDLTIESPTVGTVQVRLLLPASFDEAADAELPVLYLLHGGGGGYTDWTTNTDVEAITAATDLLVVMPAAATSYMRTGELETASDGDVGPPNWERFHLIELRELLERDWHAGERRAIGGLSLGGYAAMMYAERHPELFEVVASYSGVLDLTVAPGDPAEVKEIVEQATQIAEAAGWDEANPVNLVSSLEGTLPYISYGNGEPGQLDAPDTGHDPLEDWVGRGGHDFAAALAEAGISATVNAYGPGTHSWPYWDRELAASMPLILETLGESDVSPIE